MTEPKLTKEDRYEIAYFFKDKGCIPSWPDWESKKAIIEDEYPELIAAIQNIEIAERTLEAIVRRIEQEGY